MKWITTDYQGNTKVWYSEDVIEKIKKIAKDTVDRRMCFADEISYCNFNQILKLIQGEDK